jgi:hypothetical protein
MAKVWEISEGQINQSRSVSVPANFNLWASPRINSQIKFLLSKNLNRLTCAKKNQKQMIEIQTHLMKFLP